jgi:hypothetical protein
VLIVVEAERSARKNHGRKWHDKAPEILDQVTLGMVAICVPDEKENKARRSKPHKQRGDSKRYFFPAL